MKLYTVEYAVYGYNQISEDDYEPEIDHVFISVNAENEHEAEIFAKNRIEYETSLDLVDAHDLLSINEELK